MAFHTYTQKPIGVFVEKDTGNYFEYSKNDDNPYNGYRHKVWVGGEGVCGMWGYRYANVKKTVCYIAVDEDMNGAVVEKWYLKSNREYA